MENYKIDVRIKESLILNEKKGKGKLSEGKLKIKIKRGYNGKSISDVTLCYYGKECAGNTENRLI